MMDMNNTSEAKKPQKNLGIAGKTAKAFITSPLSLLLILAFLVIGLLGLQMTPRQEDPQISVPMVDIYVQYPGASAKEVESQVSRPLEGLMSEITGVDHVYSYSARGEAMVTVQFVVGEDLEASIVKLRDKLDSNQNTMPKGVMAVLAKPVGVDDVPLVTFTLWSNEVDDAQLRQIALDLLQSLREVSNTSQSFIVDGRKDEMRVEVKPERLATYGVSLDQVANTLRMANSQRQAGNIESSNHQINVISGTFLKSPDDINRLMVAVVKGRPVYVRDVADVISGPGNATKMVGYFTGNHIKSDLERADNAPAVTIAIAKKHGSNGVEVAEAVMVKIEQLKGHLIPDNVHIETTRDYGKSAKAKVNSLLLKLAIATLIVTVLVFLFLGWRASAVVFIIIPIVITTTVFSAWVLGLTIDRVSLFALIFSIGILVDDAIVVVENIYRRWLLDSSLSIDIAVDSVREVGNPTILATFTVIAALLPMGFVSGMMGPYMSPIPILGSVAMIISLFAAFAFTPWLTNLLKPSLANLHKAEKSEHKQAKMISAVFHKTLVPLIHSRFKGWMFLISVIVAFFISISLFYTKSVTVKMLPLDNKSEFNIIINLPEGTALPVTANLIQKMAVKLQEVNEVVALQTYSGTVSPFNFNGLVRHYYLRNQPWQGDIQVQLSDKHERSRSSHEIAESVRTMLKPMMDKAGAKMQVVEMPPGPPVLQSVVAEIYGPSAEIRRQVSKDITLLFDRTSEVSSDGKPSLADVDNFLESDHKILRFIVNTDKAQRNGISVEDINRTIEMAMGGFVIGDIKEGAVIEPTPIILQVPLDARSEIDRLAQLPIMNKMGKVIPLAELVTFKYETKNKPIFHKDLRPVEFVTAETTGSFAAPIYGMSDVESLLAQANNGKGYSAPNGSIIADGYWIRSPKSSEDVSLVWAGEWTVTYETFRDMGIAFIGALILIYMLIVGQFGNFVLPAIIMAPIPLTLIGIVPGHMILGAEFTATSMIGFIALAGIIVRNSILLVDFARESYADGETSLAKAVVKSCEARTRPITITAFALMGGSMVILSDPIFQGMAVSLIFGGFVSTLLTLIIIPLGCVNAPQSMLKKDDGDSSPNLPLQTDNLVENKLVSHTEKSDSKPESNAPIARLNVSAYEESVGEKILDVLSTIMGIIITLGGLLFSLLTGIFKWVLNLLTGSKEKKVAAEKAKAEKVEAEKAKAEKAEAEKAEKAKAEKAEAEKAKAEKAKAEKAKAEKAKAEKAKAEKAKAEKAKAEKAKAEKVKAEKAKAEKAKVEKAEAEKAAAEKAAAEKAAAEKQATATQKVTASKKSAITKKVTARKKSPVTKKAKTSKKVTTNKKKLVATTSKQSKKSPPLDDSNNAKPVSSTTKKPVKLKGRRGIRLKKDL